MFTTAYHRQYHSMWERRHSRGEQGQNQSLRRKIFEGYERKEFNRNLKRERCNRHLPSQSLPPSSCCPAIQYMWLNLLKYLRRFQFDTNWKFKSIHVRRCSCKPAWGQWGQSDPRDGSVSPQLSWSAPTLDNQGPPILVGCMLCTVRMQVPWGQPERAF